MILFGVIWLIIASRLPNSEPIRVYSEEQNRQTDKQEAAAERNRQRKLRKKLR
jgi:hypothetical protein